MHLKNILKQQIQITASLLMLVFLLIAMLNILPNNTIKTYAADIEGPINFQGKILNLSDNTQLESTGTTCINNGGADTCDFRLSLYSASTSGTLLFQEVYSNYEIGDSNGLFQFAINSVCNSWEALGSPPAGCTSSASVSGVDWASDPTLYVQIEFDTDGNGDFSSPEVFSRKLLSANAFAFNAQNADNFDGYTDDQLLKIQPTAPQEFSGGSSDSIIFLDEIGSASPAFIQLQQAGTDVFTISNTGLVSIGTGTDAFLDIKAGTTGSAQINLSSSSGTDPSTPIAGDLWFNGTELNFYNGSATIDLLVVPPDPFTDGGTTTYLTTTTDDLAIGGTTIANSIFGIDTNLGDYYFGSTGTVDPSLLFDNVNGVGLSLNFNSTGDLTLETEVSIIERSDWYDSDWDYRKKITVNSDEIDSTLTDFTVYVDLNDLGSDFFTNVETDGSDIVITSADGLTKMSRELVSIDTGGETGELWFKAPSLSSSTDTEFYIYYGNSGASETNSTTTWKSGYLMVQHLNEDPTTSAPQFQDSTSNNNDGTSAGTMTAGDLVTGKLGDGIQMDGSNDYIDIPQNSVTDISFSTWFRFDTLPGGNATIFSLEETIDGYLRMEYSPSEGGVYLYVYNGANYFIGTTSITTDEWYHVVGVKSSNVYSFYFDGVLVDNATVNSPDSGSGIDAIGARSSGGGGAYIAPITADEARIYNTAISGEHIASEYSNQNDTSNFYTVDTVETEFYDNPGLVGNVGINTDSPEAELDVVGNIQLSGDLLASSAITSNIGTALKPFANLYVNNLNIDNLTTYSGDIFIDGSILPSSSSLKSTSAYKSILTSIGYADSRWTDIALNQAGDLITAFYTDSDDTVVVTRCTDEDCAGATNITKYASGKLADYGVSVVINSDNNPIVSYHDSVGGDLEVISCDDLLCSTATIYELDTDNAGRYSDMAIGFDGNPIIVSQHGPDDRLEVTSCTANDCSTFSASILLDDSAADVGKHPSIVIRPDGTPFIVYHDETNGDLKIYACQTTTCSSGNSYTLLSAGDIGEYPEVIIGSNGYPIISYQNISDGTLEVIICQNAACTEFKKALLEYAEGQVGITNPGWGTYSASWYNSSWEYRKELTVPASKVSGSSNLTDFPLYLDLAILNDHFFSNVKSDGSDIVITTSSGTKLDRELVDIDTADQTGEIWFRDPTLEYNSDSTYYVYYGNAGASETNDAGTWTTNYINVQHLNEDPSGGSPQIIDSSQTGNNASSNGTMTSDDLVNGKIGTSIDFDGSNDYLETISNLGITSTDPRTVSVWFNADAMANRNVVGFGSPANGQLFDLLLYQNDFTGHFYGTGYSTISASSPPYTANEWYHGVITYDGTDARAYLQGNFENSTTTSLLTADSQFSIGAGIFSTYNYFDGQVDEVRVLDTVLTADWIETEFTNQNSATDFYTPSIGYIQYDVGLVVGNNVLAGNSPMGMTKKLDGSPVLSYYNENFNTLNIYECFNPLCTDGANNEITDSSDDIGTYSSIVRYPGVSDTFMSAYVNNTDNVVYTVNFENSHSSSASLGTSSNYFESIYTADIFSKNTSISNFDVAEEYFVNDRTIGPGDVVRFDADSEEGLIVEKTDLAYDEAAIGVVSTEPGLYLKGWENDRIDGRPIALVGRVPVKVSDENGPIKRGDFLTASFTPGYAMKADEDGYIIGRAMEDFNPSGVGETHSTLVQQQLKAEKKKAEKILAEYKKLQQDQGLSAEESAEIDRKINTFKKQLDEMIEKINVEGDVQSSTGTIMMYVDLRYASSEESRSKSNLASMFDEQDELDDLDSVQALFSFLTISENEITIEADELVIVGNVAVEGDFDVQGFLRAETATFDSTEIVNALQISKDSEYTGEIELESGQTSVQIPSSIVNQNSNILISISIPVNYAISNIKDEESFTFEIDEPQDENILIEYLILE